MEKSVKCLFQAVGVKGIKIIFESKFFWHVFKNVSFYLWNLWFDSRPAALPLVALFFLQQVSVKLLSEISKQRDRQCRFPSITEFRLHLVFCRFEFFPALLCLVKFNGVNRAQHAKFFFNYSQFV